MTPQVSVMSTSARARTASGSAALPSRSGWWLVAGGWRLVESKSVPQSLFLERDERTAVDENETRHPSTSFNYQLSAPAVPGAGAADGGAAVPLDGGDAVPNSSLLRAVATRSLTSHCTPTKLTMLPFPSRSAAMKKWFQKVDASIL